MTQDGIPTWAQQLIPEEQGLPWIPKSTGAHYYIWAAAALGYELTPEQAQAQINLERYDAFLRLHYLIKHPDFDSSVDLTAALHAFVENYFPRGKVLHDERWQRLSGRVFGRSDEDHYRDFGTLWHNLAQPALLMACRSVPDDLKMQDLFAYLRRYMRRTIEHDLLDGQTLDKRATTDVIPFADAGRRGLDGAEEDDWEDSYGDQEDEVAANLRRDPLRKPGRTPSTDATNAIDLVILLESFIGSIKVGDARLLTLNWEGFTSQEIASELGTTPGNVRTRLSRLRKRYAQFTSEV